MGLTRRSLLSLGALAAAGAAVPLTARAGSSTATSSRRSDKAVTPFPNLAAFTAAVGTTVVLKSERPTRLTLLDVTDLSDLQRRPGTGESFSVRFRAPSTHRLPQETYELRSARLGTLRLFLVPVGTGRNYEAVINNWTPQPRRRHRSHLV